jgi:heat shock protein HspQ
MADMETPRFTSGQIIKHLKFGYRGVITSVDPTFEGTEDWYDQVARSRPPKDKPWYHVLVDGKQHTTYVAERHLELDAEAEPIEHPMLGVFFDELQNGRYVLTRPMN